MIESAWMLAALCSAFDAGIMDAVRRPRSLTEVRERVPHLPPQLVDALVDALILSGALVRSGGLLSLGHDAEELVHSPSRIAEVAALKSALLQARRLVLAPGSTGDALCSWRHHEPEVLELQGAGGGLMARMMTTRLVPEMTGVAARLSAPGGSFLDVGTGVGRIAIGMAELWPSLHVVGLEPWGPSRALALHNVASVRLSERVEVRAQRLENLTDAGTFDLAWVPSVFISTEVIDEGLHRVHECLRPGGWIVLGIDGVSDAGGTEALTRLVTATCGGCSMGSDDAADRLRAAGFSTVRVPDLGVGPRVVLGRRSTDADRERACARPPVASAGAAG